MQIVIPMSGFGERFRRAGYTVPKPLIEVDGRPIIAYVVDLFPPDADILFLCNTEHLNEPAYRMRAILTELRPNARIVAIPNLRKGPIGAVLYARDAIDDDQPVVINYCDFTCLWDSQRFFDAVRQSGCAGAIPAYRGFHPHALGSTLYAYLQCAEVFGRTQVVHIQEKSPFTDCPMDELASSGTYYFASGRMLKAACDVLVEQNIHVQGEWYASLAYLPMLQAGLDVRAYEIHRFMQWGTPDDLAEYQGWSRAFRTIVQPITTRLPGRVVMPMAGLGQRFADAGFDLPKPLIEVSGAPMAVQANRLLPADLPPRWILRADLPHKAALEAALRVAAPEASLAELNGPTQGQAVTCLAGIAGLDDSAPVTFAACDAGLLHDAAVARHWIEDPDTDVVVWTVSGHAPAALKPHQYGWVRATGTHSGAEVLGVSVKVPLDAPQTDPVMTGTFTFKRASDARRAIARLIVRDGRVNGEYYLDACIEDALALGLRVRIHRVEHYLCWGTPDEWKTFHYWQSAFHHWSQHPYTIDADPMVSADRRAHVRAEVQLPPDGLYTLLQDPRAVLPPDVRAQTTLHTDLDSPIFSLGDDPPTLLQDTVPPDPSVMTP